MANISLITTVFNQSKYLVQTIDSVLAQNYPNLEYLIWDDGSTEDIATIVNAYAQKDSRIKFLRNPTNQGQPKALKAAIAATANPYIGWIDGDDILLPNALTKTSAILDANPNVGLVYTKYQDIDANGKVLGLGTRCQIPYSKDRLLVDFMTFHFRLLRRSAYDSVGGINDQLSCAEDYDLCLRLSEVADVSHVAEALYSYRNHPEQITTQNQVDVILSSQKIINDAILRRKLTRKLDVKVTGRFSLV